MKVTGLLKIYSSRLHQLKIPYFYGKLFYRKNNLVCVRLKVLIQEVKR